VVFPQTKTIICFIAMQTYKELTVGTVVNCCQRVATRLFFMFPFGRENLVSGHVVVKIESRPFSTASL
jgi:hypothetical protein